MIGKLIKEYLQDKGIKQNFVAEKIGITENAMSDICNGKRDISCIEYYKLCKALGIELEYFLEGVEL